MNAVPPHGVSLSSKAAAGLLLSLSVACSPARPEPTGSLARPLTAAPQIGAESRIDEPVYTEQSGEQSLRFIAAGLAFSNRPPSFSRLDANGNLLDVLPIAITPTTPSGTTFSPWLPIAAWNGDRALVFWGKSVAGGTELQGSRVTSDGTVLDPGTPELPGGIDIALGPGSRTPRAAVPFGSDFLVFWLESDGSRMTRVGRDGSVALVGGTLIGFPADGVTRNVVGAGPATGGALVLASEGSQLKVMKIDATGAATAPLSSAAGTAIALESAKAFQSAIASSGNGGLVCWSESTAATGQPVTIYGRRVGPDGAWADSAPFEVRAAGAAVGAVGAVWNGTGYACYWTDAGTRVRGTFRAIAASGTPVAAAAIGPQSLATAPVGGIQLVWTGSRYLAGMPRMVNAQIGGESLRDRQDGVLVRALGADFAPLGTDATVLTRQPNQQTSLRAVGTPAGAYIVWQDDRQRGNVDLHGVENWDVYAARLVVDAGGLGRTVVPLVAGVDSQLYPSIGWNGAELTVFYDNYTRANGHFWWAQHASPALVASGSPIGPLKDSFAGGVAVLLWNGQSFLVASLFSNTSVAFFRLSGAGKPLDAQPVFVSAGTRRNVSNLQGVAIGGAFVLLFQSTPTTTAGAPTGEDDIQALAVNADGTLPATTPTTIAGTAGAQDMPAVATDGTSAVVLWRDRGGADGPAIAGVHIDASLARQGTSGAVIAQAKAPDAMGPPAIAWTGSGYVALWPKASAGAITFNGCVLGADHRCAEGSATALPGNIAATTYNESTPGGVGATDDIRAPQLPWTDAGGVLVYRRLDAAPYVNRERVFARPIRLASVPATDGGVDGGAGRGGSGGSAAGSGGAAGAGGGAAGTGTVGAAGASGGVAGGSTAGTAGASGGVAGTGTAGTAGAGGGAAGASTVGTAGASGGSQGVAGASGGSTGGGANRGSTAVADETGCGCAIGDRQRAPLGPLLLLPALVLVRRRRPR